MRYLLLAVLVLGCTAQERAKNFGGTANEVLPDCFKLVTITWKEDHLWLLSRPMRSDEVPEKYEFNESSSWGMIQGKVRITEACTNRK